MQKKNLKKLFLLSLLAVIFYACKDVYEVEVPSETSSFSIADARNWFEANAPSIKSGGIFLRSGDEEPDEEPAPVPILNWNIAEMSRDSLWEVVELPWKYEEIDEIFALGSVWQHALANNTIPESVIRLVVMRHRETGETHGFRMKIAPTLDYLLRSGGNLHTNMYLDRDSELSGVVMFYTLRGQFLNGWIYVDGEIVSEIVGIAPRNYDDLWNRDPNHSHYFDDVVIIGQAPQRPVTGVPFLPPHPNQLMLVWREICTSGSDGGGSGGANTQAPTVDINGFSTVIMGDFANFFVGPSNFNSPIRSVSFYIRRNRGGIFNRVHTGTSLSFNMRMPNPGVWDIQTTVTFDDGNVITSPNHQFRVEFPDVGTIQSCGIISNAMRNAWQQTLSSASETGRREYGFWIYADTRGGALTFTYREIPPGPFVGCGTGAAIAPGSAFDIPGDRNNPRAGGSFYAAFFHTHTPQTFCPRYNEFGQLRVRAVGPSLSDRNFVNGRGIPGLLFDYVGNMHYGLMGIVGGHYINDPARVWTFGNHSRRRPLAD